MNLLYSEQLQNELANNILNNCYILYGNDLFLLYDNYNFLIKTAKKFNFNKIHNITFKKNFNFFNILELFQSLDIFEAKKIILLNLISNDYYNYSKQLSQLISLINQNILLIIIINKNIKNYNLFSNINKKIKFINCETPKNHYLLSWITTKAKIMNILMDSKGYKLIYENYKDNLIGIIKLLEYLSIIYANNFIEISVIKSILNTFSNFNALHWIQEIYLGNYEQSIYILQQLKLKLTDPILLSRKIQQELLLLLQLKYQTEKNNTSASIQKQYKIWKKKYQISPTIVLKNINNKLKQSLVILTDLEINIQQYPQYLIWIKLEQITLLLCKIKIIY